MASSAVLPGDVSAYSEVRFLPDVHQEIGQLHAGCHAAQLRNLLPKAFKPAARFVVPAVGQSRLHERDVFPCCDADAREIPFIKPVMRIPQHAEQRHVRGVVDHAQHVDEHRKLGELRVARRGAHHGYAPVRSACASCGPVVVSSGRSTAMSPQANPSSTSS